MDWCRSLTVVSSSHELPPARDVSGHGRNGLRRERYDGDNLAEETNSSGAAVARYWQGLNIVEQFAMLQNGTTSYYQADGLGSLTSLSNTSGTLANTYTYDSFGNLTASTGSVSNRFRFTGREFDTETGLYYYRARYYDASAGKFLSEDPLGFVGGGNFYAYVENNPVDDMDPFGLQNCNCDVPKHPDDADPEKNIQDAENHGYRWWYNTVSQGHGPWDYKYYQNVSHPEFDDFGNFNYGATGAAVGIPLDLLLRGAGWAKLRLLGPSDPFGRPWDRSGNYGNQPEKNQQIINGYNWYKNCGPHYQSNGPLNLPPGWAAPL